MLTWVWLGHHIWSFLGSKNPLLGKPETTEKGREGRGGKVKFTQE